jgi:hypothetical protein
MPTDFKVPENMQWAFKEGLGEAQDKRARQNYYEYITKQAAQEDFKNLYGNKAYAKAVGISLGDALIPYYSTARHWGELTTKDKIIYMAEDTGSVLLMLYGGKIPSAAGKILTGESKTINLASKAGEAGKILNAASSEYERALTTNVPKTEAGLVRMANKVDTARTASLKADRAFLSQIEKVNTVSIAGLKKIESNSGLKGLKNAVLDVQTASKAVDRAWQQVESMPFAIEDKPGNAISNRAYLKALENLQSKQAGLQSALDKAGSILKPRYTEKPAATEFKGFKAIWEKADPKITQHKQEILTDLQRWLDRTKASETGQVQGKTPVIEATKPLEVKPENKLTLRPEYKEPKPEGRAKVKTPKVAETEMRPFIPTKGAGKVSARRENIPTEAYGRMTYEQIRRLYGETELADVRSQSLDKALQWLKSNTGIKEWQQIRDQIDIMARQGVNPANQTQLQNMVKTALKNKEALKEEAAPRVKEVTQALNKVAVKVAVKIQVPTRINRKPGDKLRLPLRLHGGDSDATKRKFIEESEASVTYRRGELDGKGVWHTWAFNEGKPTRVIVVGPAPAGAELATGPRSAYRTAQRLGKGAFKHNLFEDTGAVDTRITSASGKPVISFQRDPSISQRPPRLSPKMPRLSARVPKLR